MNDKLRGHVEFRNPKFLDNVVEKYHLDEYGTALPREVWDPQALPEEDFIDAIKRAVVEEEDRREQERRNLSSRLLGALPR